MVLTDDLARRVFLEVSIGGRDATSALEPYLVSFTYSDQAEGKSDEISIELHDRDGKWMGGWLPSKGTAVTAKLRCLNWRGPGQHMVTGTAGNSPPTKSACPGRREK